MRAIGGSNQLLGKLPENLPHPYCRLTLSIDTSQTFWRCSCCRVSLENHTAPCCRLTLSEAACLTTASIAIESNPNPLHWNRVNMQHLKQLLSFSPNPDCYTWENQQTWLPATEWISKGTVVSREYILKWISWSCLTVTSCIINPPWAFSSFVLSPWLWHHLYIEASYM